MLHILSLIQQLCCSWCLAIDTTNSITTIWNRSYCILSIWKFQIEIYRKIKRQKLEWILLYAIYTWLISMSLCKSLEDTFSKLSISVIDEDKLETAQKIQRKVLSKCSFTKPASDFCLNCIIRLNSGIFRISECNTMKMLFP